MGEFSFLLRGDNYFLNFIMYIIIDVLYYFNCMQYLNYRTIKSGYLDQLNKQHLCKLIIVVLAYIYLIKSMD